jgi:hypothetical protein
VEVPEVTLTFPIPKGTPLGTLQEKVTPAVELDSVTRLVFCPEQMVWFKGEKVVTGAGFTVIEYVPVVPLQPFAVGVMV